MLRPRSNPLGGGQVDEQGRILTPEQVKQRQAVAQALASKASDTSPVGHWSQALNRALQGFTASYERTQADDSYNRGTDLARQKYEGRHSPVSQALAAPMTGASNGLSMGEMPAGPQAESILQGLISRGLPEHIAQGFLMNFQDESGLNPGINEISPTVPGSRGGFGLYQLTGPRRTAYEAFAGERGVDPSDTDAQLDWLMHELQGPEAKAAQSIFASQNAGEAGAAIVNNFLRPAPEHRASRAARYSGAPAGAMPYTASAPQGSGSSEIAALLADPWVKEIYGDVLGAEMQQAQGRENAMFEQQLAQQDPMYAAQLEAQQLANAQAQQSEYQERQGIGEMMGLQGDPLQRFVLTGSLPEGAEGFTLGEGEVRFDANGNLVAQGADKTANPDEYQRYAQEAQASGQPVLDRLQYEQAKKGKGFSMTMPDGTTVQMGGAQGSGPEFNDTGAFQLDTVLGDIDAILDSDLSRVTGPIQGAGGNMVDDLNLAQRMLAGEKGLTTIERIGNLQNKTWMAARDMLKGGGSITDYESRKAEGAMARLSRVKSEPEMRAALKDLREAVIEGKNKIDAAKGGATPAQQQPKGQPAQPKSKAEFDALPSGSTFIAPDGSTRRKP